MKVAAFLAVAAHLSWLSSGLAAPWFKPDITVAADGSGDFTSIQAALASIPRRTLNRNLIFVKDGVYKEKIRVETPSVTLRGQSRERTRLEFPQLEEDYTNKPDAFGAAVINIAANDFVAENLTAANTAEAGAKHAFAVFGRADRSVFLDCDLLSQGSDTVAIWGGKTNRSYYAGCKFRGSANANCPRGWAYATNCSFEILKGGSPAVWHDGSRDPEMKFVLRNCRFDGAEGWLLGRHHTDALFFFVDCTFAKTMTNAPLLGAGATEETRKSGAVVRLNRWGERAYFYHSRRDSGDFAWHRDNLSSATNAPAPGQITAAWAMGEKWDPERKAGPAIETLRPAKGSIAVVFDEIVTVKGKPRLVLKNGSFADYASGSGFHTLQFNIAADSPAEVKSVDPADGAIFASQAATTLRTATLDLPKSR